MFYILVYQTKSDGKQPPVIKADKSEVYEFIEEQDDLLSYEIFKGNRISARTFT